MNHGNIHLSCEFFTPAARFSFGGVGNTIDGEGSWEGLKVDEERGAGDTRWLALSAGGRADVNDEHVTSLTRSRQFWQIKGIAGARVTEQFNSVFAVHMLLR